MLKPTSPYPIHIHVYYLCWSAHHPRVPRLCTSHHWAQISKTETAYGPYFSCGSSADWKLQPQRRRQGTGVCVTHFPTAKKEAYVIIDTYLSSFSHTEKLRGTICFFRDAIYSLLLSIVRTSTRYVWHAGWRPQHRSWSGQEDAASITWYYPSDWYSVTGKRGRDIVSYVQQWSGGKLNAYVIWSCVVSLMTHVFNAVLNGWHDLFHATGLTGCADLPGRDRVEAGRPWEINSYLLYLLWCNSMLNPQQL